MPPYRPKNYAGFSASTETPAHTPSSPSNHAKGSAVKHAVIYATLLLLATTTSATAATMITGRQIKNNTITSADIRRNSIAIDDMSWPAAKWLTDTSERSRTESVAANNGLRVEVRCPLGDATGGGARGLNATEGWSLSIAESYPTRDGRGWITTVNNNAATPAWVVFVAMCSNPAYG